MGRGRDGEVANGKVPEEEEVVVASPHLHRPLLPPLPPPRSGEGREVVISDFGERGERENEGEKERNKDMFGSAPHLKNRYSYLGLQ